MVAVPNNDDLENESEKKICRDCGESFPKIHKYFEIKNIKGRRYMYNSCRKCYTARGLVRHSIHDIKKKTRIKLRQAPKNVVFSLLDKDPALYRIIADRVGEIEFRRLLAEEKKRIILKSKEDSDKWMKSRPNRFVRIDREYAWKVAMEELLAEKTIKV